MSWQGYPVENGMYYIKVFQGSESWYWKHTVVGATHCVQLGPMEDPDTRLKWRLDRVSGNQDAFTIRPAADLWFGLVPPTDKGRNLIEGRRGRAANWIIRKSQDGRFSKIFQDSSELVLDCREGDLEPHVHLWPNEDDVNAVGQCWVFRLSQGPGFSSAAASRNASPMRQPVLIEDDMASQSAMEDHTSTGGDLERWDGTDAGSYGRGSIHGGTTSGTHTPSGYRSEGSHTGSYGRGSVRTGTISGRSQATTEERWSETDTVTGSYGRGPLWEGTPPGSHMGDKGKADGGSYRSSPMPGYSSEDYPVLSKMQVIPKPQKISPTFENLWFTLTPEAAAQETYDIIVIGTGMGAGVIASDLFDTNSRLGPAAKSVLVIEKGGIPFHSHCLNTAPSFTFGRDNGEQTNTFFSLFKNNYQFADPALAQEWQGGSMFNLGGKAAAWSLHAPRIHDETLKNEFGQSLYTDLLRTWYKEAEDLLDVSLPSTASIHQGIMERLNMECGHGCQWQWTPVASERNQSRDSGSTHRAYSPIDKLLAIAMSKQRDKINFEFMEHQNWKLLLNTEVRSIEWAGMHDERARGVRVRDSEGQEITINLKRNGTIILGAGSVQSPAILMRSGLGRFLEDNGGLHLTDHDVLTRSVPLQFLDPSLREKAGSMRLQTHVKLRSGKIALANISIDSHSFVPRDQQAADPQLNTTDHTMLTSTYILPASLNKKNIVRLDHEDEPLIDAGREYPFSPFDFDVTELRDFDKIASMVLKEMLHLGFQAGNPHGGYNQFADDTYFEILPLGSIGHELGTIPLQRHTLPASKRVADPYCLESSLQLRGHDNVYVCDLSIFPSSPGANPALTLVALALRLSRSIHPRNPLLDVSTLSYQEQLDWSRSVVVVNQTGSPIKVFVSNVAGVPLTDAEISDRGTSILEPGERIARPRKLGTSEAVLVYRLEHNSTTEFAGRPIPYVATPGDKTPCIIE